ncbi:MAG: VOC family protein [Nocardioidaceae bacterium]|nr:VOC family protein [Nocardioidaceae bacterium]
MGESSERVAPQRLSLVTLGVKDLDRAGSFYESVGFQRPHDLPGIVFFRTAGPVLALYGWDELAADAQVPSEGSGFRGVTLACNVDSSEAVDATYRAWLRAGAKSVREPVDKEWGGYSGYVADPDGHLWELGYNPSTDLMEIGPDGILRLV